MYFAFLTGLLGSLHCAGMCGALVLALPFRTLPHNTTYQIARIGVYVVWGALLGAFGQLLMWGGAQQMLSIAWGGLLLLTLLKPTLSHQFTGWWSRYLLGFRRYFEGLVRRRDLLSAAILGVFNGLLPCGLVYLALIGAVMTNNMWQGALYMLSFGLGTLPMMALLGAHTWWLRGAWRTRFQRVVPILVMLTGLMLIVRGLGLDIPYLSPQVKQNEIHCSHCIPLTRK